MTVTIITLLTFLNLSPTQVDPNVYYQCETEKGVEFSQFPCDNNPQKKTIKGVNQPFETQPKKNHLSDLDRVHTSQKIEMVISQIKGTKSKIRSYHREEKVKSREAESKLNKLMSAEERKELAKQIKQEQKHIERSYKQMIKQQEKELKRLEKALKALQKQ